MGFERQPSIPAALHLSSSAPIALAVKAMFPFLLCLHTITPLLRMTAVIKTNGLFILFKWVGVRKYQVRGHSNEFLLG